MDKHSAILLEDFIQHVRKFKFQIKKKRQSYNNWVAHGAKWYMRIYLMRMYVLKKMQAAKPCPQIH